MARNPVSFLKRPTTRKGKYMYYLRFWNYEERRYSSSQSASVLADRLQLDTRKWPPGTKAGASYIAIEALKRGLTSTRRTNPDLAEYCRSFWDWDKSEYIQGKLARGQSIGKPYCDQLLFFIEKRVSSRVVGLKLQDVTPRHLDQLQLKLKKETALGAKSINNTLAAVCQPLREAFRLGLISKDPTVGFRTVGGDTVEKGILTGPEVSDLFKSVWTNNHIRLAVMLALSTGTRIGEVIGLTREDLSVDENQKPVVWIRHSWNLYTGLKCTKTGNIRVVPIDVQLHKELMCLLAENPYGTDFVFWYNSKDAPISHYVLENGFNRQLAKIGLDDKKRRARNISFHSLRHYYNSMIRGEVSDGILRKMTGHATEEMTDHYSHATQSDIDAIRSALEKKILPFLVSA